MEAELLSFTQQLDIGVTYLKAILDICGMKYIVLIKMDMDLNKAGSLLSYLSSRGEM